MNGLPDKYDALAGRLAYLASPYSRVACGPAEACAQVTFIANYMRRRDVRLYCPIEVCHRIAVQTGINPMDWEFWMDVQSPFLKRCDVLVIAQLEGWAESKGIAKEAEFFASAGKPIFDLDPTTLAITARAN